MILTKSIRRRSFEWKLSVLPYFFYRVLNNGARVLLKDKLYLKTRGVYNFMIFWTQNISRQLMSLFLRSQILLFFCIELPFWNRNIKNISVKVCTNIWTFWVNGVFGIDLRWETKCQLGTTISFLCSHRFQKLATFFADE